jgi:hypothetical protein
MSEDLPRLRARRDFEKVDTPDLKDWFMKGELVLAELVKSRKMLFPSTVPKRWRRDDKGKFTIRPG